MPESSELYDLTRERAEQAFQDGAWILCATLCRTLGELELAGAVQTGADEAWKVFNAFQGATRPLPTLDTWKPYATADCGAQCGIRLHAHGWAYADEGLTYREPTDWRHTADPRPGVTVPVHEPQPINIVLENRITRQDV